MPFLFGNYDYAPMPRPLYDPSRGVPRRFGGRSDRLAFVFRACTLARRVGEGADDPTGPFARARRDETPHKGPLLCRDDSLIVILLRESLLSRSICFTLLMLALTPQSGASLRLTLCVFKIALNRHRILILCLTLSVFCRGKWDQVV